MAPAGYAGSSMTEIVKRVNSHDLMKLYFIRPRSGNNIPNDGNVEPATLVT